MATNLELKARCADLALARQRARAIATRWLGVDQQLDTYFRVAAGRLKRRESSGLGDFVELEAVWDGDAAGEAEQRGKVAFLRERLAIRDADLVAAWYEGLLGL